MKLTEELIKGINATDGKLVSSASPEHGKERIERKN